MHHVSGIKCIGQFPPREQEYELYVSKSKWQDKFMPLTALEWSYKYIATKIKKSERSVQIEHWVWNMLKNKCSFLPLKQSFKLSALRKHFMPDSVHCRTPFAQSTQHLTRYKTFRCLLQSAKSGHRSGTCSWYMEYMKLSSAESKHGSISMVYSDQWQLWVTRTCSSTYHLRIF